MNYSEFVNKCTVKLQTRWDDELHAVMGVVTEAGELLDAYKKNLAYGKDLDDVNIMEELGDSIFYIQMLCNVNGWSLDDIIGRNVQKLTVRYPDKFTTESALNRDLEAERAALEGQDAPDEDDTVSR